MSELERWIAARTPPAPMSLAQWLRAPLEGASDPGPLEELCIRGEQALRTARERPGRIRESAFELLAADALFTYACEAAVDSEDVDAALARVLRSTLSR